MVGSKMRVTKYRYKVEQHQAISTEWLETHLRDMREQGWKPISVSITGTTTVVTYETWEKVRV
jgi:hypothetical protein